MHVLCPGAGWVIGNCSYSAVTLKSARSRSETPVNWGSRETLRESMGQTVAGDLVVFDESLLTLLVSPK